MGLLDLFHVSAGLAPTSTLPPVASGVAQVGGSVTTTVGTWGNAPSGFGFQWRSAATSGGTYSPIAGAVNQTYAPVSGDLGRYLDVVVVASNAFGPSAPATSNFLGPVLAAAGSSLTPHFAAVGPALILELDQSALAAGIPAALWTDITAYARDALQVKRGRANALDRIEAGTGSIPVDNGTRAFEPEYPSSPFYPNIVPRRRIRLRAVYSGVVYPLHFGNVLSWPLTWPGLKSSRATISSADGFDLLNGNQLTQVFSTALSGTLINAILDAAGWDPSLRRIDAGTETMLGIDAQDASALSLCQEVADSELGLFFISGDGYATFHDRDHRITAARSSAAQWTFGDGGPATGELPYVTPTTDYDVTRIYNVVTVASGLATPTTLPAADAASQLQYGTLSLSRTTLLASDSDAFDQANRILAANKDPHLRFPTLTLDPTRNAALWPVVLGLEISDKVILNRRPYVGGSMISKLMWVEAIQHDIGLGPPFSWLTTLSLSLADPTSYWALDDPVHSVLGTGTVLR